jgi:hypothetical protein
MFLYGVKSNRIRALQTYIDLTMSFYTLQNLNKTHIPILNLSHFSKSKSSIFDFNKDCGSLIFLVFSYFLMPVNYPSRK